MPKILLTSHGSVGDMMPVVRLGTVLRARGHEVTLAVNAGHHDRLAKWGLPLVGIGTPFDTTEFREVGRKWDMENLDPIKSMRLLANEILKPHFVSAYRDMLPLVAEYDFVLANVAAIWAAPACRKAGVPYANLHLSAAGIVSDDRPPANFPALPFFTKTWNRIGWGLARIVAHQLVSDPLAEVYAEVGLDPPENLLLEGSLSPLLNLMPLDPLWAPPASDWPDTIRQTGFLRPLPKEVADLDPALRDFVERDTNKPLVVFAFGSMYRADPREFFENLLPVVRRFGARTVIVEGWGGATGLAGEDVISVPTAPYEWLFERASLVVHHGGTGTTVDCLFAGVPQLVVAHGWDQPDNGTRVARLGCGEWLHLKDFTPDRLSGILHKLLSMKKDAVRSVRDALLPNGLEACADILTRFTA